MIFMSVGYLSQEQLGRKVIMQKGCDDCDYALDSDVHRVLSWIIFVYLGWEGR